MNCVSKRRKPNKSYCLIAVEGVDGVGKSSALKMAATMSRSNFATFKTPPDRLSVSRDIYESSAPEARFLFYLSSIAEQSNSINDALLNGSVCCDRHILSTIAYHNIMCKRQDLEKWLHFAYDLGIALPHGNIILLADKKTREGRLAKRQAENGNDFGTDANILLTDKVQDEYLRLAGTCVLKSVLVDTSNLALPKVAGIIAELIGDWRW